MPYAVAEAVAAPETADLPGISAVLHQAAARLEALRMRAYVRPDALVIPLERVHAYFPPQPEAPNADDLRLADDRWQEARAWPAAVRTMTSRLTASPSPSIMSIGKVSSVAPVSTITSSSVTARTSPASIKPRSTSAWSI